VPINQAKSIGIESAGGPVEDPELSRRLREFLIGSMSATNATVSFELIEVNDPAYALRVPESLIDIVAEGVVSGVAPRLLLYWDGVKYRSSDDHTSPIVVCARREWRPQFSQSSDPWSEARFAEEPN
jgi:hypothetical protein